MKKLYVVFDKLPSKSEGGLVATYIDFVDELSSAFDIQFVSVFRSAPTDIDEFKDIPIVTLVDRSIDNRFYRVADYFLKGHIGKGLFALWSSVLFFASIPLARIKTNRLLRNEAVVSVAPVPSVFIGSSVRFIQEIHANFEYFWGESLLGRMQSSMMQRPTLTLFRNKTDAEKGKALFPSSYIYNCFNLEKAKRLSCEQAACSPRPNALFVGRLAEQKDPIRLLEIASLVKQLIPSFSLDIYGTGDLRGRLESEIRKKGLEDTVFLKGATSDKTIYRNYDMLWLTSKFEGFGLVIIEAAANQVPTISVNWGDAAGEIIRNGESGYIAKDNEGFARYAVRLLQNEDLRMQMGNDAFRDYRARFSCEAHKARWLDIFASVYPGTCEASRNCDVE